MAGHVSIQEGEQTLRLLREMVCGLYAVRGEGGLSQVSAYAAITLSNSVGVLDLYLTGSMSSRSEDGADIMHFVLGKNWTARLSDGSTLLRICWPLGIKDYVEIGYDPSKRSNRKAFIRWQKINTPESYPVEFEAPALP